MSNMLSQSLDIIRRDGIGGYISTVRRRLLWRPIGDEVWWRVNRLVRRQKVVIKSILSYRMLIDISKEGIHRHLFLYGCHEPDCTRVFRGMLHEGISVVDIGANIGYYTLMEAEVAKKVYAIEPEPENLGMLRRNIKLNSYEDRVEVYEKAIADVSGRTLLAISTLPNQHRLRAPSGDEGRRSIEVAAVSLDEFLADKEADVIRMDLEGAEWLVVKGMKGILSGGRPLLMYIEMHPELIKDYGGDAVAMLKLLMNAGFRIRYVVASSWRGISFSNRSKVKRRLSKPQRGFEFHTSDGDSSLNDDLRRVLEGPDCYRVFLERPPLKQR